MPAANKMMPINKAISKRRVLGSFMFWIPVLARVSAQRRNGATADFPVFFGSLRAGHSQWF